MSEINNGFSVLDMAQEIAESNDVEIGDLFKKPEVKEIDKSSEISNTNNTLPVMYNDGNKEKKPWVPDAELLDGMDELNSNPVIYSKDDLKEEDGIELKNIADDNAINASKGAMDELSRKTANIEEVKKRMGIKNLHIPEGQYQVYILAAAGDLDYKKAQSGIEEVLNEIKKVYPEWIEFETPVSPTIVGKKDVGQIIDVPEDVVNKAEKNQDDDHSEVVNQDTTDEVTDISEENKDNDNVKIVIDKSQLSEVSWSPDEIEKIRKTRSVVLNIVESKDLEYSQIIDDIDENVIDEVLSPYIRKTNDIAAPLPASKYRAVFTGLSYPEVIDLENTQEMNNIDGEWKKWSIAYNHTKNPSIGPWEEYQYYIDPVSKRKVKMSMSENIPSNINPDTVVHVSKFEDFLQKTSFIDLDFILWKILCATAMTEEIISIDCHARDENGKKCDHSYDWVYRPGDLLIVDSIDKAVLDDMEKAATASSRESIEEVYKSSMLNTNNTVKLPSSDIKVVFGHISAYDYLTEIYGAVKELEDAPDDASIASKALNLSTMTVIKAFLLPKEDGRFSRVRGTNGLIKIIDKLDEIDWRTLSEIVRIMIEPYQFRYALRDIVCPKCKNRSIIPIEDMSRMLFIVAQSLSSVNVELKKI